MYRVFKLLTLILLLNLQTIYATESKEPISADFNNVSLENVIKITSKIIGKNILISTKLSGTVNFIHNKPLYKNELLDVLKTILKSKGFKLIEQNGVLNVVAIDTKDEIKVIYLKHTKADEILKIIQDLEHQQKAKKDSLINISLFKDTNAIILKGKPSKVSTISKLVKQLDIAKQQVYVQARIIEVSERKTQNIGIEYGLNGINASGSNILTFTSSLNSSQNPSIDLTQIQNSGYNLSNIKNGLSLGATINLLKQNKALDIVSEPSILCINNEESSIYVGETRSIPTGTTIGTTTTTNFQREDIGLKLIVKPQISDKNKVTLELKTILEDIKETDIVTGNPNTNKKEVITTVMVNNGESVILGGLIKNKIEKIESKVPLLGDIPYFGALFRNTYDINDKINLVVIVTPYIIPKSKDLTFVINHLSNLKKLEQKYTKILLENLEEKKSKKTKTNIDKKIEKTDISNTRLNNQQLHNQRLEEIFGL